MLALILTIRRVITTDSKASSSVDAAIPTLIHGAAGRLGCVDIMGCPMPIDAWLHRRARRSRP
jgi:hypothetical protein